MSQVDIDIKQIMKVLPHRYPFLLIDKIIGIEAGHSVVAIKNVSINEAFFQGHFPEFPIMPGVLIIEALAQTGAYGLLSSPEHQGKIALFAGVDNVRFRKPVLPGDQLRLEVEFQKARGPIVKMRGIAKINGEVACEGDFMCSVFDSNASLESGIHKTAIINPSSKIGKNIKIGPYSIIGPDVEIGDNTEIDSNVLIARWTKIGQNCKISHDATIGTPPQDLKYNGEKNEIVIGDGCTIREFVTIHLPTGEGKKTSIGNDCYIMTHSHIPHNAAIGNNVIIGGYVGIGGYTEISDYAIIGGMTGIHQFVRIGRLAMIGGQAKIVQDIPPFMLADGNPAQVRSLNLIGMQRRGVSFEAIVELKKAFKILYKSGLNLSAAIEEIKKKCASLEEITLLIVFLEKDTDRGILKKSEPSIDLLLPEIPELGI